MKQREERESKQRGKRAREEKQAHIHTRSQSHTKVAVQDDDWYAAKNAHYALCAGKQEQHHQLHKKVVIRISCRFTGMRRSDGKREREGRQSWKGMMIFSRRVLETHTAAVAETEKRKNG